MRTGSMRVAEISLPAIRHNVRHIRDLTGGQVIAVIKANGYGHGAEFAAQAAIEGGASLLGVADLEEALALRSAGVTAPIMCWLHGARVDFDAAVAHDIEIGVSHLAQLEALAEAATRAGRRASLQFKLDTGLSRNGAAPEEWEALFERGVELETTGAVRVRGVFSHLANAGEEADMAQADLFDRAVAMLREAGGTPEMVHLAASAATFARPATHYNTVRVGMAIYGLSPIVGATSQDLGLKPAMTLRSEIVSLRDIAAGTGVSYGYNHIAQSDTTLALVPIGYADGMPRALNGAGATVTVAGQHCPIIGRIGMDQCIIDLGRLGKRVNVGDSVVLFGDPATGVPPVEVWAEVVGTINYEIVAGIGSRVVRVATESPVDATATDALLEAADDAGGAAGAEVATGAAGGAGAAAEAATGAAVSGPLSPTRLNIEDPDAMHALGVQLGARLSAGDLVVLTGALGAGKTTLSRGIGEGLRVRGPITSPTFVLARTHPSLVDGPPLVHVDAYRLGSAAELDDLDIDFEGAVVIAEWGAGLLEERGSWIEITIERPTGAAAADDHETGSAPAADNTEGDVDDDADSAADRDADGDAYAVDDAMIEPRVVTIVSHGSRWAGGVL